MSDFFKTKFDNICLVGLIVFLVCVLVYFQDKSDDKVVAWFEQAITTVMGAYIGLTQAHRLPWANGKNGGTNVSTTTVNAGTPAANPAP
jgi:hypothetical protein